MADTGVTLNRPEQFAERFVETYLHQGFGTLGKRDVELLLFILLERDGVVRRDATNYEVAKQLRVTLAKVRALRRDAYARWGTLLGGEALDQVREVLRRLLQIEAVKQSMAHVSPDQRAAGFIAVRVEHPVDREELEQVIRDVGGLPEYGRNRDILLVRFTVLLDIAERLGITDEQARKAASHLRKHAKDVDSLQDLLTADMATLSAQDVRAGLNAAAAEVVAKGPSAAFTALVTAMRMLI
jgi:hypothetical protein